MENDEEIDELINQQSASEEEESSSGKSYVLLSGSNNNYFKSHDEASEKLSNIDLEDDPMEIDIDSIKPSVSKDHFKKDDLEQGTDLINMFLSGDIDFSQYAQQMSGNILEESADEEQLQPETVELKLTMGEQSRKIKSEQRKVKKSGHRWKTKLPQALKGLIGEANVCYARGDKQTAIDMCLEVIRLHPQASEAFFTLSHIYEDSGESEKAMQMSLIGAHLNPSNKEIWLQVAEKSEKLGYIKQAIVCYTQALKKDWDVELLTKRTELYLQFGDKKAYHRGLLKMLDLARSKNEYDQELETSKRLAEYYFREENDLENARKALESAFNNCSKNIKFEHINLYLELLILSKDFIKCLEILVEHCGLEFEADVNDKLDSISVVSISIPSDMMVDILAKLIVALILMKCNHLFDQIFPRILSVDPNDAGDLYLDIAETLIAENWFEEALKFLEPLTESQNFSLPAVWIRKAECLTALKKYKEAISVYKTVLEKVPLHYDARLALVDLLTKVGEKEDAIQVLSFNLNDSEFDLKLTYEKCMLLKNDIRKEDEFIKLAELILYRHFGKIRNLDEKAAVAQLKSSKHRSEAILKIRKLRNENLSDDEDCPIFHETDETPTFQQEFDLFISLCNIYIKRKSYATLQRLTFSAMLSKKFVNVPDLPIFAFLSCFFLDGGSLGFDFGRMLLAECNYENPRIWNLLSLLFEYIDHSRVYKFLTRLTAKMHGNLYVSQLKANCCLLAHIAHKFALNDFALLYRKYPENPLMAFLTGLCFIQLVCQKYSNKHLLFSQGIAFLSKYIEIRGNECFQEIHYNVGRVFHQLNLLPYAVHHYSQALNCEPVINSSMYDLKRESAYNLHLIYLNSGEVDLARSVLEKYIVV